MWCNGAVELVRSSRTFLAELHMRCKALETQVPVPHFPRCGTGKRVLSDLTEMWKGPFIHISEVSASCRIGNLARV